MNKITIKNSVKIIDDKYVIKKRVREDIGSVYDYLISRSFDYFPKPTFIDDNEIYNYIIDTKEPLEQKATDIMFLISLLHSKTTFYREIDVDKYKEVYESILDKINYLNGYYSDIISLIEKEIYMSPASYLLARNIDIVFSSIYFAKDNLEKWYTFICDSKNERVVNIHNSVSLDHYIKSDKGYLISWNKSKIDSPIFDLLSFYKNHAMDFDFGNLFRFYESKYPLKEEERLLLFTYMAIPDEIYFSLSQYELCQRVNRVIGYLYRTCNVIMNYSK